MSKKNFCILVGVYIGITETACSIGMQDEGNNCHAIFSLESLPYPDVVKIASQISETVSTMPEPRLQRLRIASNLDIKVDLKTELKSQDISSDIEVISKLSEDSYLKLVYALANSKMSGVNSGIAERINWRLGNFDLSSPDPCIASLVLLRSIGKEGQGLMRSGL